MKSSDPSSSLCVHPPVDGSIYWHYYVCTCRILTTARNVPIKLLDAYTSKEVAVFIALDTAFEPVGAKSVQFTLDGTRIIGGYEKFICLFDVNRPGNSKDYICRYTLGGWFSRATILITPVLVSKDDVQKGFISTIACGESLFAIGSYNRLISLYDIKSQSNIGVLQGHKGGVTHLIISPDETKLFSGGRRVGGQSNGWIEPE